MVELKVTPYHETSLYIGSVLPNGKEFSQQDLEKCIGLFQDDYEQIIPVRITPTSFVSGSDYTEKGWKVCAINYPKLDIKIVDIDNFMRKLAINLLENFRQYSICVINPTQILMYKDDEQSS